MPIMGTVTQLLISLGTQLPLLAVWAIGAVLALAFWNRDPRNALLIFLACLVCLFSDVAFSAVYAVLPQFLHGEMEFGWMGVQTIYSAIGLVRSCLFAVAWVLVLVAVFHRRPAA